MNLITAIVFTLLVKLYVNNFSEFLYTDMGWTLLQMLYSVVTINIVLMVFNLIPLPPLDGHHILQDIGGRRVYNFYHITFDVRFTKDFKLVGLDYSFIVWVENIFDNRNVDYVYAATGRPDTQQNQNQIIKGGTPYDLNPDNWDYGRQIKVGLEVNL